MVQSLTFQPLGTDPCQIMTYSARIFFIELQKFASKNADKRELING
ncbi:MAG: hypothetical protein LBP41_04445 [Holosporaceae bacterium]|nr:hypothetical protein [Holosporaceae bacterium]